MAVRRTILGLLICAFFSAAPVFAGGGRDALTVTLANTIAKLNRQAVDSEGAAQLANLIESEYGVRSDEMRWAEKHSITWGETAALAYIQATTGRSFAELTKEDARRDFGLYAEKAGMNCEKMVHSLENLLNKAEREVNSRIFDRLRASRRVHPLPDLGSGFGLFQEALDFRRIDVPGSTKIHVDSSALAKGEK